MKKDKFADQERAAENNDAILTLDEPVDGRTASVRDDAIHEEIARLAYSWEDRGYESGSPETDWFRAVDELRSR
jgi:hypothetical protein